MTRGSKGSAYPFWKGHTIALGLLPITTRPLLTFPHFLPLKEGKKNGISHLLRMWWSKNGSKSDVCLLCGASILSNEQLNSSNGGLCLGLLHIRVGAIHLLPWQWPVSNSQVWPQLLKIHMFLQENIEIILQTTSIICFSKTNDISDVICHSFIHFMILVIKRKHTEA